ncbi:MAG: type I-U CRISPR-associated protein Cas7 [Deltaproteobacteria bacterium]
MLQNLKNSRRMLIETQLCPVQGDRFQPTGFADLGAATYQAPDGTSMLLVETAQSIANRLEATILTAGNELSDEFAGLSYIKVKMQGASDSETNSLIEAHRINSPFIISDKEFKEKFKKESDYAKGKPINWQKIAKTIYRYDINALLHGVFMANLEDGRVKVARALSGFVEAKGVREVVSGGTKNNPLDPTGKLRAAEFNKNVYGNVPYQRVEFTAEKIIAYFNFDLGLLRSYDLGNDATDLLIALGLLKIRRFLDSGLRLRTACDLKIKDGIQVKEPDGFLIPEEKSLLDFIKTKIQQTKDMFASPPVTIIATETKIVEKDDDNDTKPDINDDADAS